MNLATGRSAPRRALAACLLALLAWGTAAQAEELPAQPTKEQVHKLLSLLDDRSTNAGDYLAQVLAEQTRGEEKSVRQIRLYRRDRENRILLLVTGPRTEAGKGYLSEAKNFWAYDPEVGRWERKTVREAIGGTDGTRSDFDRTNWATYFESTYLAREKLGAYDADVIQLTAKPNVDVAYPLVKLWVDRNTSNILKREEYAGSGKLLRRVLVPRWRKVPNVGSTGDFWYPEQTLIYDELERGNWTRFTIRAVDMRPLDSNVFTKAWLEARSR
jgi:hypothetical protein